MILFRKIKFAEIYQNFIVLFFLLIVAWLLWFNLQKRIWINQENEAIHYMETGNLSGAALIFQKLKQQYRRETDRQRIDEYLIDCYLQLAETPGTSTEVSLLYYKRIYYLNPSRVPESVRLRLFRNSTSSDQ